jgi:hypothetical protein
MISGTCSNCGKTKDKLLRCGGACGGSVAYCNKDCQIADWKAGHKQKCGKKKKIDSTREGTCVLSSLDAPVPLKCFHELDGFGKSGLSVYYSDHMGEEALRPHIIQLFGEVDDEMEWNAKGIQKIPWEIVTKPRP